MGLFGITIAILHGESTYKNKAGESQPCFLYNGIIYEILFSILYKDYNGILY